MKKFTSRSFALILMLLCVSCGPSTLSFGSALNSSEGKIALVQYDANSHFGDYEYNRSALTSLSNEAVSHGSNIVVFPEGSLYGYRTGNTDWCLPGVQGAKDGCRDVRTIAEPIPEGRSTQYWTQYARQKKTYVLFNLPEIGSDGYFYNTTVAVGPDGYVTKYRKRDLTVNDQYSYWPNKNPVFLETPYGKFGLLICLDSVENDGYIEEYKRLGADAIILMSDWGASIGNQAASFQFALRARQVGIDIYNSDAASWDGTAKYFATGAPRERNGLPPVAEGQNGISYHTLHYR